MEWTEDYSDRPLRKTVYVVPFEQESDNDAYIVRCDSASDSELRLAKLAKLAKKDHNER